jgi:hypothetical protein
LNAHAIRIRSSVALTFIDMHVTINGILTLLEAHAATEMIKDAILKDLLTSGWYCSHGTGPSSKNLSTKIETEIQPISLTFAQAEGKTSACVFNNN